jgi:hypothetical protein
MAKRSKIKKQKYYKKDDLMDLATTAVKAGVVLGVANTVINATRTNP